MSTIPFENQLLPSNPIEQLEQKLAYGMAVPGDELCHVIECSTDRPLDDRIRKIISRFSVPVAKRRGRPCTDKGREDFALQKVDDLYPALLRKYEERARKQRFSATEEGAVLPRAEQTPSELAYREILDLKGMKAVFRTSGGRRCETCIPNGIVAIFILKTTTSIPTTTTLKSSASFPRRQNHNYSVDFAGLQLTAQGSFLGS